MTNNELINNMSVEQLMAKCKCRVIALDAMNGKQLFDTRKNKREFVYKFAKGNISAVWAGIDNHKAVGFSNGIIPAVMIYVSHNSWLESEVEE